MERWCHRLLGRERPRAEDARRRDRAHPEGETEYLEGTEFEIECDLVLLSIGFTGPVHDKFLEDLNLGYADDGAIPAEDGFGTSEPGVFVAGDAKRGADLIVTAIYEGRKAARQVDIYLTGESVLSSLGQEPTLG